jgi:hypothetical protein
MKERKSGALGRATAVAEGFAAAARRRAREREPRVVLYDEEGLSFLLKPSERGFDDLIEIGERMVAAVTPPSPGEAGK